MNSSISLLCIGTPSQKNGHLDTKQLFSVIDQFCEVLQEKEAFHTIAVRSTVPPGTNKQIVNMLNKTLTERNNNFSVVSNPEFLREGSGVKDFLNPPYILIASEQTRGLEITKELYSCIECDSIETQIGVAEMIKYVNNTFHALKITFANEIGRISKSLGINSHELMRIFCLDKQLNISTAYFRPGFAYGGSCLPKDMQALNTLAHDQYVSVPVIKAVQLSNEIQIDEGWHLIEKVGKKNILFLGISFKAGTDDLRNSPAVELVEKLLGKGYQVKIYDESVALSNLTGRNKQYITEKLPYLERLLINNILEIDKKTELIVITNLNATYKNIIQNLHVPVIDLAGLLRIDNLDKPVYNLFS